MQARGETVRWEQEAQRRSRRDSIHFDIDGVRCAVSRGQTISARLCHLSWLYSLLLRAQQHLAKLELDGIYPIAGSFGSSRTVEGILPEFLPAGRTFRRRAARFCGAHWQC